MLKDTGERIKAVRRFLNLNQQDFADLLNVTQSNVSKYERGENELSMASLRILGEKGININWLVTGQGNMLAESSSSIQNRNVFALSPDEYAAEDDILRDEIFMAEGEDDKNQEILQLRNDLEVTKKENKYLKNEMAEIKKDVEQYKNQTDEMVSELLIRVKGIEHSKKTKT
jgi:transcriptional regulator with XRE-family HTH domain